ncbi:hypothetical protein BVRB_4g083460 [Beta vulgaris subsp. vulgaris]|nr:hypothetical protein BVRB_4g083460 [Beta vulgaris subsp. vulgaris]
MNVSSSRSHCVYIFTVQQTTPVDKRETDSCGLGWL